MTILYNSKKRKPRTWVLIVFLLVPVFIILIFLTLTQDSVQKYRAEKKAAEREDIFDRF